jgi:hypothetical protein
VLVGVTLYSIIPSVIVALEIIVEIMKLFQKELPSMSCKYGPHFFQYGYKFFYHWPINWWWG